ncbi:PREDICTED: serine/threonine-protein kinase Tao-like, partial [Rhagoletis zephyria]|uniref:serine/threonine-protein kinase Tao-like n=1 Tax=Rhagoletis zephyria TaxID=28612 RepID=UPI000811547E
AGNLKDPEISQYFDKEDPEKIFTDLREIGHGSFGAVYYARNIATKEVVAIKKMSFTGKQSTEKWQDILKEVKFLKTVKHRNTIDYKGCYLKENTAWLVMEYCLGSASDIIEVHKKPLREEEISAICHDSLKGLEYLHYQCRIHRDVKAGNILLTEVGTVKLADFGSASMGSPANSFVGTPYWMAPEVILAMDEGQYDGKVDVWSLGITCIELAERKPPYFNLNAMSALYHIAQNEAPTLPPPDWSDAFRNFVASCLRKSPAERPTSSAMLTHSFITRPRSATVILDLINRTKTAVRELDNLNYRKMKKILMVESRDSDSSVSSYSNNGNSSSGNGNGNGNNNKSNSVASYGSRQSGGLVSSQSSSTSSIPAANSASASTTELDHCPRSGLGRGEAMLGDSSYRNPLSLRRESASSFSAGGQSSRVSPSNSSASINSTEICVGAGAPGTGGNNDPSGLVDGVRLGGRAHHHNNNFATLRTTSIVTRQLKEHARENQLHEQMSGYKRMRRQHQKAIIQLEMRCRAEIEEHKTKLDKEYETLLQAFGKELEKLQLKHQAELEKKLKGNAGQERKISKQILAGQEEELKRSATLHKREYKCIKERLKRECPTTDDYKARIGELQRAHQASLSKQQQTNQEYYRAEIRKFRRRKLIQFNQTERELLREELNKRQGQLETAHSMLMRHHEITQELEYHQQRAIHTLREEQIRKQHNTELSNQNEYIAKQLSELHKKHALEVKQQPKSLKAKEVQIRKQFRETCKTQTLQYKAWKEQILSSTPKEEQKMVIKRLKDEQVRKLQMLGEQYEQSIADMLQKQSIRLDETQELEERQLREQLEQEKELLIAFQSKIKMQAEMQRTKERTELEERVRIRKQLLEKKMENERAQFQDERNERRRLLLERQAREIEEFDLESTAMGFNALVIADASAEPYGSTFFDGVGGGGGGADGDAASVSGGSLLSLAHSNSATSFTHTAL